MESSKEMWNVANPPQPTEVAALWQLLRPQLNKSAQNNNSQIFPCQDSVPWGKKAAREEITEGCCKGTPNSEVIEAIPNQSDSLEVWGGFEEVGVFRDEGLRGGMWD